MKSWFISELVTGHHLLIDLLGKTLLLALALKVATLPFRNLFAYVFRLCELHYWLFFSLCNDHQQAERQIF